MARKQRSDKGKVRLPVATEPSRTKISDGPTTGYRDGPGGVVETANFADGYLPAGWVDSPAKCENCDGKSHPEYVRVEV